MPIASSQWDVVLDYIGLGAAEIDLHRNWKRVNTPLADWLGYSQEELLSLPFERIFDLAEPERDVRDRQLLLDGKLRSYSVEATALCKNGGSLWVRLSISAARNPGIDEVHPLLLLVEDLTALQAATHALAEAETARLEVAKKLTSK